MRYPRSQAWVVLKAVGLFGKRQLGLHVPCSSDRSHLVIRETLAMGKIFAHFKADVQLQDHRGHHEDGCIAIASLTSKKMAYVQSQGTQQKAPQSSTSREFGLVSTKCNKLSPLEAALVSGPVSPLYIQCVENDQIRTDVAGTRSHGIGRVKSG